MAITRQTDRRKGNRRQINHRKGDGKTIKIGVEGDNGKEVTVRYETGL